MSVEGDSFAVVLIDTHCHLDAAAFDADRDSLVAGAQKSGVGRMIVPSVNVQNFLMVRECCCRYSLCRPAYGIHPLFVGNCQNHDLVTLRRFLQLEMSGDFPPVAVGEIGLDFFVPGADAVRQAFFFTEQLKIARDLDLPVLLHMRRAVDEVFKYLRRFGIRRGIAHAFNGSVQQAEAFIKQGFKLGFGGAMTYPRATRIRQLAVKLPLEAIVLETDAPDIPPVWIAGQRNTPLELPKIAGTLAELRTQSLDTVKMTVAANVGFVANLSVKS